MPLDERHEPIVVAVPFASSGPDHPARYYHHRQDRPFQYSLPYFAAIAKRLQEADSIALIGHGRGQSNVAHGLRDYLIHAGSPVAARIRCELDVDLSAKTSRQLLLLARDALERDRQLHGEAG